MRNIVGFFPTYMRPPYSSCNAACEATLKDLGYHISFFNLDTDDYNNDSPTLIQNAKNNFANAVNPSNPSTNSFLVISHDIHEQTAHALTAYMLTTLQAKGYRAVTMGTCMGDPAANWYRTAGTVITPPVCAPLSIIKPSQLKLTLHCSPSPPPPRLQAQPPHQAQPAPSRLVPGARSRWRHTPPPLPAGLPSETAGTRVTYAGARPRLILAQITRMCAKLKKTTANPVQTAGPRTVPS